MKERQLGEAPNALKVIVKQGISRMTSCNTHHPNVYRQLAICTANSVVQQWFEVNFNQK
jgi:hypothetical protein